MEQDLEMPDLKLIALWHLIFPSPGRDDEWEKYLPEPYMPMMAYAGLVNQTWQQAFESGKMQEENLDNEKAHIALGLIPRSKRMEYGLKLTRRLLQEVQKHVSIQNGMFVIFRVVEDPAKMDWSENTYVFKGKYYKASEAQVEENIRYINHGFEEYVVPVTVEDSTVGPVDHHLNDMRLIR